MTDAIPAAARRVLDQGVLCHLACPSPFGPHLTPVVYALDAGRLWITTARHSVKARTWRSDPRAAGTVRSGSLAVAFRGRVRLYDALDPATWAPSLIDSPTLASAATKFTVKNSRFFAGYAVDARRVPLSWSPPGRVFAGIRLEAGRLLDLEGARVLDGWGPWPGGSAALRAFDEGPRRRGIDLGVPDSVRATIGRSGDGVAAVAGAEGIAALPVRWNRVGTLGAFDAVLPAAFADLWGMDGGEAPGALTVDRASRWRAAEMAGMLLRGTARVYSRAGTARGRRALAARVGPGEVLLRLVPERVVWWEGWTSGTVRGRPGPVPRARQPAPATT